MQDYWKQLRWTASGPGWRAKTDTFMLFVPDAIYQQHLKRYFEHIGLALKTRLRNYATRRGRVETAVRS